MSVHHFDIEDAKLYGVDCAVILYNLKFWLSKNKANQQNIHDGQVWTYNKLDAWCELFPYYSRRQIERILKNLEKAGLLLKGNYNSNKFDKTVWYSLNLPEYRLQTPKTAISPNGEIDKTKRGNGCHKTVNSLHIKNTDSKSVNSNEIQNFSAERSEKTEGFEEKVITELLSDNLPKSKVRYARLKIQEFIGRFPCSNSVADCWSYVVQAVNHQYAITGS